MRYLLDTDHISFLQRRTGPEHVALVSRMARHPHGDFGFSVISFHEQALGAHTYVSRGRTTAEVVRGYVLMGEILRGFLAAPVLFAIRSWPVRLSLIILVMVWAGTAFPVTYISDFLVGVVLAMLFAENRMPDFGNWQAVVLVVVAVYLFSFIYEQKLLIHAPIKAMLPVGNNSHFIWDAGAALMILLLLGNPFLRRAFSKT